MPRTSCATTYRTCAITGFAVCGPLVIMRSRAITRSTSTIITGGITSVGIRVRSLCSRHYGATAKSTHNYGCAVAVVCRCRVTPLAASCSSTAIINTGRRNLAGCLAVIVSRLRINIGVSASIGALNRRQTAAIIRRSTMRCTSYITTVITCSITRI